MAQSTIPISSAEIVARAMSIPDLTGSQHITYQDQYRSLNESWKTVYSNLSTNDDDYYIKESITAISSSQQSTTTGAWEYFIPFPDDFMKLRYIEWFSGPNWIPMDKYNLDNKGMQAAFPMYHDRNNGVLIISGMLSSSVSSVRIGYIPKPDVITLPDVPIQYGLSYSAANFNNISQQTYVNIISSRI